MEYFNDFMHEYGIQIAYALLTAVAAWIGNVISKYYRKWVNTREKKELAKTVVTAVEQIYKTLHGEEKFAKAYEALSEMLADHGIHITDLEIKMLIEAAVGEANNAFQRGNETAAEVEQALTEADDDSVTDPAQVKLEGIDK